VLAWTEDERVCTECVMEVPEGPSVVWRPDTGRTVLSAKPSSAMPFSAGAGVAIAVAEGGFSEDPESVPDRPDSLWLSAGGALVRVAQGAAFPWKSGGLLTGGPTRILVVGRGIRAALAAVWR
jgi:hypothetical protein